MERFHDWQSRPLPRAASLERYRSSQYARPGVYVVLNHGEPLYVGDTLNVRDRVAQIMNTEAWMRFGPTSARLIDARDQQMQYGIQSILIGRTAPILNSGMLRPEGDAATAVAHEFQPAP